MEKPRKVKVEIVNEKKPTKQYKFIKAIKKFWFRIKLSIAIILDVIDLFIGWIPLVNSAFDIISFIILLVILKNKRIALLSLIELPLFGIPPFSIIDMFLPICTVCVLLDSGEMNSSNSHNNNIYIKRFDF